MWIITSQSWRVWLDSALLTEKHAYSVNLLAYWRRDETEPWLLATNLPTPRATVRAYKKRMLLDEMLGGFKKRGFALEDSYLRHFLRLSRLKLFSQPPVKRG